MDDPQTRAGRALLDRWSKASMDPDIDFRARDMRDGVLAVEAEARAAALAEARLAVEKVRPVHTHSTAPGQLCIPALCPRGMQELVIDRLSEPGA